MGIGGAEFRAGDAVNCMKVHVELYRRLQPQVKHAYERDAREYGHQKARELEDLRGTHEQAIQKLQQEWRDYVAGTGLPNHSGVVRFNDDDFNEIHATLSSSEYLGDNLKGLRRAAQEAPEVHHPSLRME